MEGGELLQPKKIFRRIADKLTGRKTPEQPEFTPAPQPEKADQLEGFIQQGLKLIKSGQHSAAIRYFGDSEEVERLGIHYARDAITILIDQLPIPTANEQAEMITSVARRCHFYPPRSKEGFPSIKLSDVVIDINPEDPEGPFSLAGENLPERLASQIPVSLFQNTALNYAEEWLHALQFFRGSQPIAGYKNIEIDVAAYLQNQGVPLTDEFLARYQRRQVLFEGKPPPTIPIA